MPFMKNSSRLLWAVSSPIFVPVAFENYSGMYMPPVYRVRMRKRDRNRGEGREAARSLPI